MNGILYRHLSDSNEIITLEAGKTVSENLPDIDYENTIILINGKKSTPETIVYEADTVMIRTLPAESTGSIGWDIFLGVITFGIFTGVVAYKQQQRLDAELEKLKKQSGNDSIDNRPFIRGASNALATGKSQPYICGRHLFTPYLSSFPFYKIVGADGSDQYYYAILECGFNKQILEQMKVDDIVIKTFTDTAPQQGTYDFNSDSIFYSPESKIEIIQDGGRFSAIPELNVKTVTETANKQIPYADQIADGSKTHLQFTLAQNAKSADVVITFNNGLFAYNDENDKVSTSIDIIPEYSLTGGKNESDWTPFFFDQNGSKSNTFKRNIQKEIRFTAHVDFTSAQVANRTEPVLLRVRTPANKDSKKTNACYVMYVQTACFDATVWAEKKQFVDCKVIEDRERAFCTMLGIRIKATAANEDKLNKINVITHGIARIWDGVKWSDGKTATRNPAAILLEVLTSETHPASRFSDDEIDLPSFGDLYEYCKENGYSFDKVIANGVTKQDTINQILSVCDSVLYKNIVGKYAIATDTKKTNAISVFNSQNIISIENRKEFKRRTDGIRIKFVNEAAGFAEDSYLVMRAGVGLTQDSVLRELTVDGITEYEHIVKYARRIMAAESLRPKTTTIQIGHEGVFFTPFSKILLQDDSLKIGLSSGTIQTVHSENGFITGFTLYDAVDFTDEYKYGMIINCINETAATIASVKVTGSGFTKEVTLVSPIPIPPADQPQTVPTSGDTFSFGLLNNDGGFDKITSPFVITGMAKTENGYSLELVDYNEALYDTGDIPEYKSNITERPGETKDEIKPDYITKEDLFDIVGTDKATDYPDNVYGVSASGERDYIQIKWSPIGNGNRNRLQKYLVRISKDGGKTFNQYESADIEYVYYFNRNTDGYPERENLENYRVQIKAVNMFGKESLQWSESAPVNTSRYGTWIPATPHLDAYASKRTAQLNFTRNDCYGFKEYRLQISKDGITWYSTGESASAETNEASWSGTRDWHTSVSGGQYTQVLPLAGQAAGLPVDTTYYFRACCVTSIPTQAKPEAVNVSAYSASSTVLARGTGVKDIVAAAIGSAQLQQNAVRLENLNVLAKNAVNSFIDGTKEGWQDTPNCEIATDPQTGLSVLQITGQSGERRCTSNYFTVLPDDIFCLSAGLETLSYTDKYIYFGIEVTSADKRIYSRSTYNFTTNAWGSWVGDQFNVDILYQTSNVTTNRRFIKTYICGSNVTIDKLPPPSFTDMQYGINAVKLKSGVNKAAVQFRWDGITNKWLFITPQAYRIGDGKVIASNIICNDLVSIAGKFGYIDTEKILLDETNFMTSKATTVRQKDGSSYAAAAREVCFGTTVKTSGYAESDEFFHYKPGSGFFFKIKNFIVTAAASMIKGVFQVFRKGENTNPIFEVNPGAGAGNESTRVHGAFRVYKDKEPVSPIMEVLYNRLVINHPTYLLNGLIYANPDFKTFSVTNPKSNWLHLCTVSWNFQGIIKITEVGNTVETQAHLTFMSGHSNAPFIFLNFAKNNANYGMLRLVVTRDSKEFNSNINVYIVESHIDEYILLLHTVEINRGSLVSYLNGRIGTVPTGIILDLNTAAVNGTVFSGDVTMRNLTAASVTANNISAGNINAPIYGLDFANGIIEGSVFSDTFANGTFKIPKGTYFISAQRMHTDFQSTLTISQSDVIIAYGFNIAVPGGAAGRLAVYSMVVSNGSNVLIKSSGNNVVSVNYIKLA